MNRKAPSGVGFRRLAQVCAVLSGSAALVIGIGWCLGHWRFATFGPDYVPMAPLTAWLIVVLAAALFLLASWPSARQCRAFGLGAAALVALMVVLQWGTNQLGFDFLVERWLAPSAAQVGGIITGRMSPLTAFSFLLTAAAMWLAASRWNRSPFAAQVAAGGAAVVVLIGFVVIVGYASRLPFMYGGTIIPMALLTAVAFAALGTGLLAVVVSDQGWRGVISGEPPSEADESSRRFERRLLAAFVLFIGAIGVVGSLYLRRQMADLRTTLENELSAIADLKANQIGRWLHERRSDAELVARNPAMSTQLARLLAASPDGGSNHELLAWMESLRQSYGYERIELRNAQAAAVLSVPPSPTNDEPQLAEHIRTALRTKNTVFWDLHRGAAEHEIHIDFVVPLGGAVALDSPPEGVFVFRINPHDFLYPQIQSWPMQSRTAETLLVRRDGDEVLFLNELRHRKHTALLLRQPVGASRLAAAAAVRGKVGVFDAVDYRGVPVLAATRAVPESPWLLIAKIDREEIFAPLRHRAWTAGVLLASLIVVVALSVIHLWRARFADSLRRELDLERDRKSLVERIALLSKHANDILLFADDQWRVLDANDRAAEAFGCMLQELQRLSLRDLLAEESATAFEDLARQVDSQDGLLVEMTCRRRDGTVFLAESSMRAVILDGKRFRQAILRDITQRKAHEREIERLSRLYATLSQINQSIVRVKSQQELFQEVCRVTAQFGRFQVVWVGRRDPETQQVVPVARGGDDDGYLDGIEVYADDRPQGRGPVGTCIRENRPCVFNDFLNDPKALPWREAASACGVRAVAAVPIRLGGVVWGAFAVYDREAGIFQDKEVALLEEAALDISYAMESLDHERQRRQAEEALREQDELLRDMSDLAHIGGWEFDPATGRGTWTEQIARIHDWDPALEATVELGLSVFHGPWRQKIETALREAVELGRPYDLELEMVTAKGNRKWVRTVGVPVMRDGRVVNVHGTMQDITDRKRAEAAHRESEEHFQAMFQVASIGMAQADPQTGRWLRVNQKLCAITGYSADEMLRMRIPEITHPDDRQTDWELFQRVVRGEAPDYRSEKRYICKGGSIAWVSVNMTVLRDAAGRPTRTMATIEDITDRKRAEEEREVTVRLLGLLNASNDLHALMRDVTLLLQDWFGCQATGIRLRDNDDYPYFETRGFPPEFVLAENQLCVRDSAGRAVCDAKGCPVLECMCGNVLCGRFDSAQPFFTTRGSFWTNCTTDLLAGTTEADRQAQTRNRCNGEGYESVALVALRVGETTYGLLQVNDKRPNRFTPERIALLERLADSLAIAVAHRQSARMLRESEERYRLLADNAEDFVLLNSTDGHRLYVSPSFHRATGWTLEELQSSDWRSRIHPDDLPLVERTRAENLAGRSTQVDYRILCKDGSWLWVETRCRPITGSDGQVHQMQLCARDVTQRKQAEEEIRRLNAELEQRVRDRTSELQAANKELEAFSYSVSHDLRSPLRSINGFASIVRKRSAQQLDPESRRFLDLVVSESVRMGRLIDDLLAFSRLGRQPIQREPVDMEALARTVFAELIEREPERTVRLTLDPLEPARGDPAMIRQVWTNLLSNAIKYTGTRPVAEIRIGSRLVDGEVTYFVQDNGVGFAMQQAKKLFGVFQRLHTSAEFEGTGVGLALVQRILSRHGGRIWFDAQVDAGATFYFTLPNKDL